MRPIQVFQSRGAAGGGGGVSAFRDLLLTHSPSMYLRLGEASGTTAANETGGDNGTYSNHTLGQAALYTGGPTSFKPTNSSGKVTWAPTTVPALTNMTVGCIFKASTVTGVHPIVNRDPGSGTRHFQFRINGTNADFIRLVGGTTTVSKPHGMAAGDIALMTMTYAASGVVKIYKNSSQLSTDGAVPAALNFGGGSNAQPFTVANLSSSATAITADLFSEAFIIPSVLSGAQIAALASAAGL